jgi:hypothetical protein
MVMAGFTLKAPCAVARQRSESTLTHCDWMMRKHFSHACSEKVRTIEVLCCMSAGLERNEVQATSPGAVSSRTPGEYTGLQHSVPHGDRVKCYHLAQTH